MPCSEPLFLSHFFCNFATLKLYGKKLSNQKLEIRNFRMTTLDIILLIPLAYGLIRGFFRGFFKEVASLVGIFFGIFVAKWLGLGFAGFLQAQFDWSPQVAQPVAYMVLFLLVAIALNVVAWLLAKVLSAASLGWVNKLAGGLFGFLKFALVLSLLLNCFVRINNVTHWADENTLEKSALYKPVKAIVPTILPTVQKLFFDTDE